MISIKILILLFFLQEIDVQGKKAIMIFVPVPQLRAYQKIQTRLVRELEKKFSGKHVVFIAQVGFGVFFYFDIISLSAVDAWRSVEVVKWKSWIFIILVSDVMWMTFED